MDIISIFHRFPTHESCIEHLEQVRWKGEPECIARRTWLQKLAHRPLELPCLQVLFQRPVRHDLSRDAYTAPEVVPRLVIGIEC